MQLIALFLPAREEQGDLLWRLPANVEGDQVAVRLSNRSGLRGHVVPSYQRDANMRAPMLLLSPINGLGIFWVMDAHTLGNGRRPYVSVTEIILDALIFADAEPARREFRHLSAPPARSAPSPPPAPSA